MRTSPCSVAPPSVSACCAAAVCLAALAACGPGPDERATGSLRAEAAKHDSARAAGQTFTLRAQKDGYRCVDLAQPAAAPGQDQYYGNTIKLLAMMALSDLWMVP